MGRREIISNIHEMKSKVKVCLNCGRRHYKPICPVCLSPSWRKMEDDEYRALLVQKTGRMSCSDLDEEDLQIIKDEFRAYGWVDIREGRISMAKARKKLIAVIFSEGKKVFGETEAKARIEGFLEKKTGNKYLSSCSEDQLRMVIGWIRRSAKYQQKGGKDEGDT